LDALKAGKLTDEITDVIQTVAKKFQQNITKSKVESKVLSSNGFQVLLLYT
jgi:hypothetical protein